MKHHAHHHHSKPDNDAIDAILRDKMEEILELIEAIESGEKDVDVLLAKMLEGEQDVVRAVIVEKLRALMQNRDEEQSKKLEQAIAQQKAQEQVIARGMFERWLMWIMSETTLRKIRESFLMRPFVQHQVEHVGEELSRKGVIGVNIQQQQGQGVDVSRRELGSLVANISAALGRGKDRGQGRQ